MRFQPACMDAGKGREQDAEALPERWVADKFKDFHVDGFKLIKR